MSGPSRPVEPEGFIDRDPFPSSDRVAYGLALPSPGLQASSPMEAGSWSGGHPRERIRPGRDAELVQLGPLIGP
jgi:hypothetical protein